MTTTAEGRSLLVWMIVFTVLVVLTLVGRFWACYLQRRRIRLDDGLIVFAFLNLLALEIPTWIVYNHNLGAHVTQLSADDASLALKVEFSASITWTLATCSCKVAVLWMYLHIFPSKKMKIAIYSLIALEVGFVIAFVPIFLTICNPPSAFWSVDPIEQATQCHPIQQQQYASVAVNMVLDLAVVVLPLPSIWQLQLPIGKKVFITLMFSMGLTIVSVMAWRIYTTYQSSTYADWSYLLTTIALQSHLELWLGIMAANLPMMGQLFRASAIKSIFSKISNSGYFSRGTNRRHTTQDSANSKMFRNTRKKFEQIEGESKSSTEIPLAKIMAQPDDDLEHGLGSHPWSKGIRRGVEVRVESVSKEQNHEASRHLAPRASPWR